MPFAVELKYCEDSEVWYPSASCSSEYETVSAAIRCIYDCQSIGASEPQFYRVIDTDTQRVVAVWSQLFSRFIGVTYDLSNPPYFVEYYHLSGRWYRSMDLWRAYPTIWAASGALESYENNSVNQYRVVDNNGSPAWYKINPSISSNQPIQSDSAKDNMPETISSPPMPASAADTESPPMVDVEIVRSKPSNRLSLRISAKPLHDYLESIGVETRGNEFVDQPAVNFNIVNGDTLSSKLFLRREYPVTVDLSSIFTQPPTPQRLLNVARSANAVVKSILAHYQPVDIKISIHKRVG